MISLHKIHSKNHQLRFSRKFQDFQKYHLRISTNFSTEKFTRIRQLLAILKSGVQRHGFIFDFCAPRTPCHDRTTMYSVQVCVSEPSQDLAFSTLKLFSCSVFEGLKIIVLLCAFVFFFFFWDIARCSCLVLSCRLVNSQEGVY